MQEIERTNGNDMKRAFFSMVSRIGLCVGLKIFLQVNWIPRFDLVV